MAQRISIEAGCSQPSRRPDTPQQLAVDLHQITFCFQAWHINNHPVSESAVSNRKMAEFVQGSLSRESAKRWSVTTSPPLRPKPSLAAPVSIRVKRKAKAGIQPPKSPAEDDRAIFLELVRFRDQEYPKIAKDYFSNNLRRRLDFHNVFAITTSGRRVEELETVVVSAKLNIRMAAALSTFGSRAWGDVSEGFASQSSNRPATPEAPFKARLFLHRRYSDAWSVASDEVVSCPNSPDEIGSAADEDETLVAHEDEQLEEQDDEEWETISKKEAREACSEKENSVVKTSTETETDELLPKAIHNTVSRIGPSFPFDFAWCILKPYMPFQGRLAAVTRCAKVLVSGDVRPYNVVLKKFNKVALIRKRSKTMRSYKLLGSSSAPPRAVSHSFLGVSASLALVSARWIMSQVKKVLRRVGRMMLRQDIR